MSSLSSIVDRRIGKGKSAENRRKFLERVRDSVREAMPTILNEGSLKDIGKKGGRVTVKRNTISEPSFRFGKGGSNDHVLPGNKEYVPGDTIKKNDGNSQGQGSKASDSGEAEDPFIIQISREEFLNYFFEDLQLPDLVRKDLSELTEKKMKNSGFSTTGTPAKLAVVRSMKMAHLRKMALKGAQLEQIEEVEGQLSALQEHELEKRAFLSERLKDLKERKGLVSFIDPLDLRYRSSVVQEVPITSATMVCIMDNSGSMGEREKTLSRKFFYLLYLFLERKYEKIDLVFISHTDKAKEVSEKEFFNTRESGGTIVSSALKVLEDLIAKKINPRQTNIYVCQCSDGDNYSSDNELCARLLKEKLMPAVQYWAYIQIEPESYQPGREGADDSLWGVYKRVSEQHKNMVGCHVSKDADIYPVFRSLFDKKSKASN